SAAALVAAGVLAAGGYSASLSGYWNHFAAWAYVPAIAALSRSGLGSRGQRIGLAVLIGLQAEAGSPEISAGSLLLALVLAATFREDAPEGWAPTRPATSVGRALVASVLGLLLAAWALVPFAELALRSDRARPLPSLEREYGALGIRGIA